MNKMIELKQKEIDAISGGLSFGDAAIIIVLLSSEHARDILNDTAKDIVQIIEESYKTFKKAAFVFLNLASFAISGEFATGKFATKLQQSCFAKDNLS